MDIKDLAIPDYEKVTRTELLPGIPSFIAIHNTHLGPALGGVRMHAYASEEEALTDVLRLAEGMSYKAAMAGLKLGGGKAVIMADPAKQKSKKLFEAFGEFVDALGGKYLTAKDVGVELADLDIIATKTSYIRGTSAQGSSGDPSPMTAFGVYQGIRAAAKFKWGSDSLKGKTVLLQGLGHVGMEVAKYLLQEGAQVIGCDVNPASVERASKMGVQTKRAEEWLKIKADLFCPCALGGMVNSQTIPRLKANGIQIIAGGANNQLLDVEKDAWHLQKAGILYAPDYVLNAGGIINIFCELDGYDPGRAQKITSQIYDTSWCIFERAQAEGEPTALVSLKIAREKLGLG